MPRIFIAIRFEDEFKQKLAAIQDALRQKGVQGNYCPYRNLHMTLAFVGEHYDLPSIREALSEVTFEPFSISLGSLGSFPTKAGVIWCGVKDPDDVTSLANRLRERLIAHGVSFSETEFFPHISLVQHPSTLITDIRVPEASADVSKIYIMKSERVNGELVYSEIEAVSAELFHTTKPFNDYVNRAVDYAINELK